MEKCLIAYFSWGGNTEVIARMIQEITGGDIFHIEAVKPYPEGYNETTKVAKRELKSDARPELTSLISNMVSYDVLFLGYPIWWGTMPMAVCTFLESYDFSSKTIIPFCTHEGSGLGRSVADIKKLCSKSEIMNAIAFHGGRVKNSKNDVKNWIKIVSQALSRNSRNSN